MMIVSVIAMMLQTATSNACVAWRDPDSGKMLNARDLREREDGMRKRVFNSEASDRSVIQTARAALPCAKRANDPKGD